MSPEGAAAAMLREDAAARMLGIRVVEVARGRCTATMTVRDDMVNGHAIAHGGLVAALADTAFAVACNSYGTVTVASGFEVDFLEPAYAGDELRATATERVVRGRSGIYDVTVTRGATVVAEFRGRSRSLGRPLD